MLLGLCVLSGHDWHSKESDTRSLFQILTPTKPSEDEHENASDADVSEAGSDWDVRIGVGGSGHLDDRGNSGGSRIRGSSSGGSGNSGSIGNGSGSVQLAEEFEGYERQSPLHQEECEGSSDYEGAE